MRNYIVQMFFQGPTDFVFYGPFKSYEQGEKWASNRMKRYKGASRFEVFGLLTPVDGGPHA